MRCLPRARSPTATTRPGRQPAPSGRRSRGRRPWPAVVLIHGGFWRYGWDRTLMTPLARDLAAQGIAAWNIEYRRVGQEGGGWPGTLEDVAAAADAVVGLEAVDAGRVATVGHSAGGPPGALARCAAPPPRGSTRRRSATATVRRGLAGGCQRPRRRSPGRARQWCLPGAPRRRARRRPGALRGRLTRGAAAARRAAAPRPRRRATTSCLPLRAGTTQRRRERSGTRSISSSYPMPITST